MTYLTTENNQEITLPLYGSVEAYVNWGDGTPEELFETSGNYNHTYIIAGEYQVSISGTLERFGNGIEGYPNADKLIRVNNFGTIGLISLSGAFKDAVNLISIPSFIPSSIEDLKYCFYGASSFNDPNITSWDISNIKNTSYMFFNATSFNQNIFNWTPTNKLKNFRFMLYGAISYSHIISGWLEDKLDILAIEP